MIEDYRDRAGVIAANGYGFTIDTSATNALQASTTAPAATDPVNGREWVTDQEMTMGVHVLAVDRQYACIFKVPARDCTLAQNSNACDCPSKPGLSAAQTPPLCDPNTPTSQNRGQGVSDDPGADCGAPHGQPGHRCVALPDRRHRQHDDERPALRVPTRRRGHHRPPQERAQQPVPARAAQRRPDRWDGAVPHPRHDADAGHAQRRHLPQPRLQSGRRRHHPDQPRRSRQLLRLARDGLQSGRRHPRGDRGSGAPVRLRAERADADGQCGGLRHDGLVPGVGRPGLVLRARAGGQGLPTGNRLPEGLAARGSRREPAVHRAELQEQGPALRTTADCCSVTPALNCVNGTCE